MTKEKLYQSAQRHFDANEKDNLYYVTDDGACFLSWHDANEHSKTLGVRAIEEISREGVKGASIESQIEKVNAATSLEEWGKLKPANKTAKAVWDAWTAKGEELKLKKEKEDAAAKE
jgi:hypothetical protein